MVSMLLAMTLLVAPAGPSLQEDLVATVREMFDALLAGDKGVWDKRLASEFVLVDRDGAVKTREEFLKEADPPPPSVRVQLEVAEPRVQDLGEAAVLTFTTREHEQIWGQSLDVDYRNTMVFARRDGAWRLVSWQYVEVPRDAAPVAVSAAALPALEGEYEAAPGTTFTVVRREGRLFGARAGRKEAELVPEGETVFFTPGTEFRKIFVKDAQGRVSGMLDRRKGSDTFWRKVK